MIWFDTTVGGDLGAQLMVHYDNEYKIDSIIIDSHYFFDAEGNPLNQVDNNHNEDNNGRQ